MNFVYFKSINAGINLNQIEWFSLEKDNRLTIKMNSNQRFFINDEGEVNFFLLMAAAMEISEDET